jgi:hypothetical protein
MNERIKEIALECYSPYTNFDHAKFAELIVQECAGIIEMQDVDPAFKNRMSWAIRKHFGVE